MHKDILYRIDNDFDWIGLGSKTLDLQTWQHTCISLDMLTGQVKV